MSKTFLIIDCNFLCHRAFNSMDGLAHGETAAGVTFGFIKDCQSLINRFHTKNIIFAFDHGRGKRFDIYPKYKEKREIEKLEASEEEKESRQELYDQMDDLKKKWLPSMGFANVFYQKGYEGDDIIAEIAARVPSKHKAIIISADQDLYQCLRDNVEFYNPNFGDKPNITKQSFIENYGVTPDQWWQVKALAGCSSDGVKGISGVGEVKAIKFLRGELNKGVILDRITEDTAKTKEQGGLYETNVELVKLPLAGTKRSKIKKDEYNQKAFKKMCKKLGFKALAGGGKQTGLIKQKEKTFYG